jgi:hypothetical protein
MVKFKESSIRHDFSLVVLVLVNLPLNHLHFSLPCRILPRLGPLANWCRTVRYLEILFSFGVVVVMRRNPARNMRASCLSACFMYDVLSL